MENVKNFTKHTRKRVKTKKIYPYEDTIENIIDNIGNTRIVSKVQVDVGYPIDIKYIENRNSFLPEAKSFADKIAGEHYVLPTKEDGTKISEYERSIIAANWASLWNKVFHQKIESIAHQNRIKEAQIEKNNYECTTA